MGTLNGGINGPSSRISSILYSLANSIAVAMSDFSLLMSSAKLNICGDENFVNSLGFSGNIPKDSPLKKRFKSGNMTARDPYNPIKPMFILSTPLAASILAYVSNTLRGSAFAIY